MSGYIEERKGILFVLSAPSGAGKTTVASMLLSRTEGLRKSISHTTRQIRKGETSGLDYFFVNEKEFNEMIDRGEFIEWALVHGNYYGTSLANIENIVKKNGSDLLLDIDVQGAATLREKGVNCSTILLLPPSMDELKRRLVSRADESEESISTRLANAPKELGEIDKFDYVVINDDLGKAVSEVCAIIIAERLKVANRTIRLKGLQR